MRFSNKIKTSVFCVLCSVFSLFAFAALANEQPPFEEIKPRLEIPVPGLQFSDIIRTPGGELFVSYLPEYISAIYSYFVGIAGIVAVAMIMYGGMKWIFAGGDATKISAARETISHAVIGLALALGSYLILFTLNPNLVSFKALRVLFVQSDPLEAELLTTEEDTQLEEGTTASTSADCPISLENEALRRRTISRERGQFDVEPRTQEFNQEIQAAITGATPRERVLQVAEAALECGIHSGACGNTVSNINGLAGVGYNHGNPNHEMRGEITRYLIEINRTKRSTLCPEGNTRECRERLRQMAWERIKRTMPDWPEAWLNELQPGDVIWYYNANSGRAGQHSMIFMGWQSRERGVAKVIQGASGRLVNMGTPCIGSNCPRPYPITRTYRPQ